MKPSPDSSRCNPTLHHIDSRFAAVWTQVLQQLLAVAGDGLGARRALSIRSSYRERLAIQVRGEGARGGPCQERASSRAPNVSASESSASSCVVSVLSGRPASQPAVRIALDRKPGHQRSPPWPEPGTCQAASARSVLARTCPRWPTGDRRPAAALAAALPSASLRARPEPGRAGPSPRPSRLRARGHALDLARGPGRTRSAASGSGTRPRSGLAS